MDTLCFQSESQLENSSQNYSTYQLKVQEEERWYKMIRERSTKCYYLIMASEWLSCCSVAQLCPTFCNPMDCSMLGFPVLRYLPELAQTQVHSISDAIQPSCSLSSPSPPAFNLSQHQSLFQWVSSLHQMAKRLELHFQHQSFQWIFRVDCLEDWLIWSPCCSRDTQESSPAPQFGDINEMAALLLETKVFIATIHLELYRGIELIFLHYLI